MTLLQTLETLNAQKQYTGTRFDSLRFSQVIASDLMSDVLVTDWDGFLLVTSLPSDQSARTADMVGACAIVLVNGKKPQPPLLKLCEELDLPLLTTSFSCFETCVALGRQLQP